MYSIKLKKADLSLKTSIKELGKLEKSYKSELRMMAMMASKFKSKLSKINEPMKTQAETEATKVRMYETHFPGFCYQKDGKYRKRAISNVIIRNPTSAESSETVKSLLFTNNELDIGKVICLHLLGTHTPYRRYIQRREGRACIFIRSQAYGNRRFTLQSISQRINPEIKEVPSASDKTLPRYVLEVSGLERNFSSLSVRTCDTDSLSDDETSKWRKFQVPIYINTGIIAIINSVLESLQAVNSPKLEELLDLVHNTDKLRNFLAQEYIEEYMIELAEKSLIHNPNSYNFVVTHVVFDKISTIDAVAQVLELPANYGVKNLLSMIRKNISRRYEELVLCNVIPGKLKRKHSSKGSVSHNLSKTSFLSRGPSTRNFNIGSAFPMRALGSQYRFFKFNIDHNDKTKLENNQFEASSEASNEKTYSLSNSLILRNRPSKYGIKSIRSIFPNSPMSFSKMSSAAYEGDASIMDNKDGTNWEKLGRFPENETNKYDLKSLNNSQRILLGLKVASLKSRPLNMHQFENKKKSEVGSIITSIIQGLVNNKTELAYGESKHEEQKRIKKTVSKIANKDQNLGNLTREILSDFRHDVATTENKKRVKEFMDNQI